MSALAVPVPVGPAADVIAQVNGEPITQEAFGEAAAVDAAMSALLETAPASASELLDQLVNHHLVLRAAAAAGRAPGNAGQRLAALLAAHGKTPTALDTVLQAHAVARRPFETYLGELVLVEQFAADEAARQGLTVAAYVATLQQAADIRYLADPPALPPAAELVPDTAPHTVTDTANETVTATVSEEPRGVQVGQLAPWFELPVLDRAAAATFDDFLGTPTVLSFWTTWCPYCRRQTPVMVAAAGRYPAGQVQFAGIDVGEGADAVRTYVAEHDIPYPILLDADSEAAGAYAVTGYPTTYFLDATGRVAALHIGAMSEQQLTDYLRRLLATP
jgi:thiol-disulfide isomerase/thioredoxin